MIANLQEEQHPFYDNQFQRSQHTLFKPTSTIVRLTLRTLAKFLLLYPITARVPFSSCSTDQKERTDRYLNNVQELARAAIVPSETPEASFDYWRAWLGDYSSSEARIKNEVIHSRYEKLSEWKHYAGKERIISCNCNAACCSAGAT